MSAPPWRASAGSCSYTVRSRTSTSVTRTARYRRPAARSAKRWRALRAMAPGRARGVMRSWCAGSSTGCSATTASAMEMRDLLATRAALPPSGRSAGRAPSSGWRRAHEIVARHHALRRAHRRRARLARRGQQVRLLRGKALDRPLMRGAMDAHIGDRGVPVGELLVEDPRCR